MAPKPPNAHSPSMIVVGLAYTAGDIAHWTWYVDGDAGPEYSSRNKALDGLDSEIGRRGLRDYTLGPDKPLATVRRT